MIDGRFKRGALISLAMLSFGLSACGGDKQASSQSDGSETKTIRYGYVPVITSLLVLAAEDQGIFAKNGLKVELRPTQVISNLAPGLGRQYDISFATPYDFLMASARGIDVQSVTGIAQVSKENLGSPIVAGKDTGITSPKDLVGKTIGLPEVNGPARLMTETWLTSNGVDPDQLDYVEMPFPTMADQLSAGRIDAAFTVAPFTGLMVSRGDVALGDAVLAIGPPTVLAGLTATSSRFAEENPETIEKFRASLLEAEKFVEGNEAEARRLLVEQLKIPARVAKAFPLPEWSLDVGPADFTDWIERMQTGGKFKGVDVPEAAALVGE